MGGWTSSPMGKTYLSTAVTEDGKPKELVSNTRIRLEFAVVPNRNEEGPRVYDVLRVYAGCNRLGAAVAAGELLADGRLWIDGVGSTAKGCRPPRQAQDEWLTKFLVSKPSWHLNGDQLTLTSAGTTITLLDRKIAEPDFPLDGPKVEGGHRHHQGRRPPRYHHHAEEAWITFDGERLTGWTGCNELSGNRRPHHNRTDLHRRRHHQPHMHKGNRRGGDRHPRPPSAPRPPTPSTTTV